MPEVATNSVSTGTANREAGSSEMLLTPNEVAEARRQLARLVDGLNTVILGQNQLVELVAICLVARGHVLLEGLPGLGKTELVSHIEIRRHGLLLRALRVYACYDYRTQDL